VREWIGAVLSDEVGRSYKLLLVLVSTVIFGSESRRILLAHDSGSLGTDCFMMSRLKVCAIPPQILNIQLKLETEKRIHCQKHRRTWGEGTSQALALPSGLLKEKESQN
jgi:hypothetical protein